MSAEGNLYNPTLFLPSLDPSQSEHTPHADIAMEYLQIAKSLKTVTDLTAVKGHLFKIMRPGFLKALDLRDKMGKHPHIRRDANRDEIEEGLLYFEEVVKEMKERMDVSAFSLLSVTCD